VVRSKLVLLGQELMLSIAVSSGLAAAAAVAGGAYAHDDVDDGDNGGGDGGFVGHFFRAPCR